MRRVGPEVWLTASKAFRKASAQVYATVLERFGDEYMDWEVQEEPDSPLLAAGSAAT